MSSIPTKTVRTLVLRPGEKGVINKNVNIVSVVKDADVDATTSCLDVQERLDNADAFTCFKIMWAIEVDSGGSGNHTGPWSISDTNNPIKIVEFSIAGKTFSLDLIGDGQFHLPPDNVVANDSELFIRLGSSSANLPIRLVEHMLVNSTGERYEARLIFKAPSLAGETAYLKFAGPGVQGARVYALPCEGCCGSST